MFIARTRFSLFLPFSSEWLVTRNNEDIESYKRNLFDETRLNFRIEFMTHITLPLLAKISGNEDFLHIIEYSDSLPNKYILLLKEIESTYSFVNLVCYDDKGNTESNISAIAYHHFNLENVEEEVMIGRFILDDDDCLSSNYFEIMKPYLHKSFDGFYISAGTGAVGLFNEEFKLEVCAKIYKPKINIGFMNVGRYCPKQKSLVFNEKVTRHSRMDEVNRVVLDSRQIAFFWSRHPLQDTRSNKSNRTIRRTIAEIENLPKLSNITILQNFDDSFLQKLNQFNSKGEFDKSLTIEFANSEHNVSNDTERFEFSPFKELGLNEEVRLIISNDKTNLLVRSKIIPPNESCQFFFDKSENIVDLKYKYQIMTLVDNKSKWVNIDQGYSFIVNK